MGVLELASGKSAYRGYEYYKNGKVIELKKPDNGLLTARVQGSGGEVYDVVVNLAHPRKSQCTCPYAAGRQILCKHKVAAYFAAFPKEAKQYIEELERSWAEEEQLQQELDDRLERYILSMKKSELQDALLALLYDGPEWQLESFVEEYIYTDKPDDTDDW